ncbi:MAG: PRC-barrel domain-containing protein [Phormidesmis sp.]
MPLTSFKNFFSKLRNPLQVVWPGGNLMAYAVCSDNDRKVGQIKDLLVDESGSFRYLAIEAVIGELSKAVLVPIGLARFDYAHRQVCVAGLSAARLAKTPRYDDNMEIGEGYEQRVRDAYGAVAACRAGHRFLQHPYTVNGQFTGGSSGYTPSAAQAYSRNPTFYGMSDRDNQRPLKRLENLLNP